MLQTVRHPELGELKLVRNPMVLAQANAADTDVIAPPVLGPAAVLA